MTALPRKTRLDQMLTDAGYAASRSRARDMITRGCVKVNGVTASKAGQSVSPSCHVEIDDPAADYVSRAALKLKAGLEASQIIVKGCSALDLGASTGGFTQVLLENDAQSIVAIDVGHGQLASKIKDDTRVINLENTNARHLTGDMLPFKPNLIVSDLSFVSLKIAAGPALQLCQDTAHCILLVKPQFEVGKEGIGKGGVVTDQRLIDETIASIKTWFCSLPGWTITHFLPSPIQGADGNHEYLLCGARGHGN